MVLQDNGGDNLTVSANGSFTFATKLASGASYNVTVQANPTGQTCTTANGTGTIASANITNVTVTCTANTAGSGSDDFNRANGSLGPNWTDASDGGLTITGQQVAGTAGNSYSGDIRTAETYPADQFSQITLTSTQLTGGQWIGAAIRMQNGGQNQYLGIYFWNNGSPDLMLFKRNASNWTQLGTTYNSGPLSAGTTLQVQATGSTISLLQNGVQRISATDTSVATGAPGIMAYGTGKADNWSGGAASSGGGTATYSIGGTLSGATGTVILQDNGGDNLTVTGQRPVHLRHQAGQRGCLRGHRPDPAGRADLHRSQRLGHDRLGQCHQRRGHLHVQRDLFGRRRPSPACRAAWSCRTTAATT